MARAGTGQARGQIKSRRHANQHAARTRRPGGEAGWVSLDRMRGANYMRGMRVHFVVHEAFESPGSLVEWASERGHVVRYSRVHAGEPLPASVEELDMLVVMGGSMSPTTSIAERPDFDSAAEQLLIVRCIEAGRPVVGICLGAQLVGAALGAAHERSPAKEIGTFPITLTEDGMGHPLLADFGETLPVAHWHGDMPGLTADARVLATSAGCPRQIVEYGPLVYGFQCHLELTRECVARLVDASRDELAASAGLPFVEQPDALLAHDHDEMNRKLAGFMDRLAAR